MDSPSGVSWYNRVVNGLQSQERLLSVFDLLFFGRHVIWNVFIANRQ